MKRLNLEYVTKSQLRELYAELAGNCAEPEKESEFVSLLHRGEENFETLNDADRITRCCGVETLYHAISINNGYDVYYLNMGDPYVTTLMCTPDGFYVGCYSEVLESAHYMRKWRVSL